MLFVVMFASLALLSCFSPTSPKPDKDEPIAPIPYTGPAGTGGVTFNFNFNTEGTTSARGLTDVIGVTYLTVQLYSEEQKSTLFQTAAVVAGTGSVSFGGLIPGYWNATARLYDAPETAVLLYYGSARISVVSGINASTTLPVYAVGTLPIVVSSGIYADDVAVVDQEGYSSATYPKGREYQLLANLTSIDGMPDQQVYWTTSDPRVATVDQNGLVRTITLGEATITVTALIGGANNTYTITVVEDYVGTWLMIENGEGMYYTVLDIGPTTYTEYAWYDGGASYSYKGTIEKSGTDSFIQTDTQSLNLTTGEYMSMEVPYPYQMFYELDPEGGIIFDPRNEPLTYQKLNSFISVDSITLPQATMDQFATGITTNNYYPLNTTYVPSTPTVTAAFYSILRPTLGGDGAVIPYYWDYSTDTDVTGSSGYISYDEIYFYNNELLYPVTYKLRIRSLSDPNVVTDIPVTVYVPVTGISFANVATPPTQIPVVWNSAYNLGTVTYTPSNATYQSFTYEILDNAYTASSAGSMSSNSVTFTALGTYYVRIKRLEDGATMLDIPFLVGSY